MPGIVGIIFRDGRAARDLPIDMMVACLKREPFDRGGTYVNAELGLALGWVAHEGAFADGMPVWNERRDVGVIFAGEEFADRSVIDALRDRGHQLAADSASYLPHWYEKRGMEFAGELNGYFSGIVVDLRERQAVLFNDRYGLGRVYYHESGDSLYFASEAKALLKVLPELRRLDPRGFAEFFACGSALQNRTLFSGISLLPAGSRWTFQPGRPVRKEGYFNLSAWESQARLSPSEYYAKLAATFTRVLPRYFRGPGRVAVSLTGGLDSRMIVAGLAGRETVVWPCYTFGGMYRECADVRLARRIASACGQVHTVIPVGPEFFPRFPELAERAVHGTDGAMDVTGAVELYVNQFARAIAPVRLTGNYGSEILRGNVVFKVGAINPLLFDRSFILLINEAAETFARERRMNRTSFIVSRQVPWYHYARLAVEQSQLTVRSPFLDNDLVAVAFQAPAELVVNKGLAHRFIAEHRPALAEIPTDRGVVARNGHAGGRMAVFCQELMPRMEYLFDYGMPQWLAKIDRWTSPLQVERLFLGRQKFYHFRVWYRNELSDFVQDMLLDARTLGRPYLDARQVRTMVNAHVKGRGNYTVEIHKLLTSELIQRRLIEQN